MLEPQRPHSATGLFRCDFLRVTWTTIRFTFHTKSESQVGTNYYSGWGCQDYQSKTIDVQPAGWRLFYTAQHGDCLPPMSPLPSQTPWLCTHLLSCRHLPSSRYNWSNSSGSCLITTGIGAKLGSLSSRTSGSVAGD